MSPQARITPPSSLGEALRPVAEFSESEFAHIVRAISGRRSFSLSSDDLNSLQKEIAPNKANLPYFFGALRYLYAQATRAVETGARYEEILSALIDELDEDAKWGDQKTVAENRLRNLLEKRESHEKFQKLERLQSGFLPNALSFSSFVDLRPDFEDGEHFSVRGYLPIIQFRVATDSNSTDFKRIVFQMDEDTLNELKKAVDRAEKKLKALSNDPAVTLKITKL